MSKGHNILPTRSSFFISSAGKIKNVQESATSALPPARASMPASNCFGK